MNPLMLFVSCWLFVVLAHAIWRARHDGLKLVADSELSARIIAAMDFSNRQMVAAFAEWNETLSRAREAFEAFGRVVNENRQSDIAALSPSERVIYNQRMAAGGYHLDTIDDIYEARASM